MNIDKAFGRHFSIGDMVMESDDLVERRLSDLRGFFADTAAYDRALSENDPVIYQVYGQTTTDGDGDLHYGLGVLMSGKVGEEYYMTKGHIHEWREAAEVYVGLSGSGLMLLEDIETSESRTFSLGKERIVYVPGMTAHRTINTGDNPLVYLGIYPARAGHDYGYLTEKNFRKVVVGSEDGVRVVDRWEYLN